MAFKQFAENVDRGNPQRDNKGMRRFFRIIESSLGDALERGQEEGSYNPDVMRTSKNIEQILESGTGMMDINPSGPRGVHDMYNSYFIMDIAVDVVAQNISAGASIATDIFIGMWNSFDIFQQIEWANNNDVRIQLMNDCYVTSNLLRLTVSEDARRQNDMVYTSSQVFHGNTDVGKCGTVIQLPAAIPANEYIVFQRSAADNRPKFRIMIPMYMFDIFATIRYYPSLFNLLPFKFIPTSRYFIW
jgi:hypothetical protein